MKNLKRNANYEITGPHEERIRPYILVGDDEEPDGLITERYSVRWMEIARDEQHAIELAKTKRVPLDDQTKENYNFIPQLKLPKKPKGSTTVYLTQCDYSPAPEIGLVANLDDGRILFVNLA